MLDVDCILALYFMHEVWRAQVILYLSWICTYVSSRFEHLHAAPFRRSRDI